MSEVGYKPRFEAEILYDYEHLRLLETYVESMGWTLQLLGGHALITKDGYREPYILEDANSAVAFFESEGARPAGMRIIRVVYDSALGVDELTPDPDDIKDDDVGLTA